MANNSTVSDGDMKYLPNETFDSDTLSSAFYSLIFIFSVTGNVLLLCVLITYENLKNVTNLFVLNLACSDLVFTFTLPFWAVYNLHHWIFGDFACKFMVAAYFVGVYCSVILLTAMTVDRFTTVVLHNWPNKPVWRQRCAMAACAAAWVISIAASMRDAIQVKVEIQWNGQYMCDALSNGPDANQGYYLQVSLLFFLPFVIIVFCYSAILKTVLQTSYRRSVRTVVVVLCIVTAFFLCWGPYNILMIILSLHEDCDESWFSAFYICRILAFSHCCMNPLLYMLSQKLRRHLLQLLHCKNACRKNRERGTGHSTSVLHNVAFTAQTSAVTMDYHSK
ncbi:hypothetical protein L3Q82_006133 [Scortum barcoo]|uniref:Uncharacterized protein n=1 Tax=Scortum barcoo TaxID=214431 RepID=A0ACB8X2K6_9TELE|nr:hypothetical protein L3Q82_006133 [Scortum barcoo]